MADLTSLLTSGALAVGQNLFQRNASQGLQNLVGTGADIYNNQQLRDAEQNRISQINQGFNQARGEIKEFGNAALDAATSGTGIANKSIRDATGRAVEAQQPFYDTGLSALSEFQSILQNPDQILNDPGVQFQYQQGLESVNRMAERNNLLNSSAKLNAATEFGQGLASTSMDSALNRRLPLIQGGQNAANTMSQANITEGTNLANVNTQQGRTLADINMQMGENLADLSLGQNALLSNRDLADAVSQTGLLDILTGGSAGGGFGGGGGIPAEAGEPGFIEGLSDSVKSLFGGGEGAGIAGAAALGINTAPAIAGSNLMGVTTGGTAALTTGATTGFGAGATGTLAGAVTPGIGASQLGLTSGAGTSLTATGQGASAFGAPAGFGQTAGGGAEAGSTLAARGTPLSPATAAAWAGPIQAGVALLRGEGMGQAASQGLGAAGGAALGAQIGAAGGPVGATVGAILGGFMGGIGGGSIGKALGLSASGGGDDKPDYSLVTGHGERDISSESPWGTIGFGHQKHLTNTSRYQAGLDVVTESDKIIAAQLSPEENEAIKQAFDKHTVARNSNEGGFNPGRMMGHFFNDRAKVLKQTLGQERFAQLKLDEIYAALSSGDQQQINAAFT